MKLRTFVDADSDVFLAKFESAYRQLFGQVIDGLEVEITNWSLTVATTRQMIPKVKRNLAGHKLQFREKRNFFDAALRRTVSATSVQRSAMQPNVQLDGPAVIIEDETATIVTSGFTAIGQADGSLLLLRKEPTQ